MFRAIAYITSEPGLRLVLPAIGLCMFACATVLAMISHVRGTKEGARLRAHIHELEKTRRQLEATSSNLSAALAQTDAANKAKSEFLAALSHELRKPLNSVLGFSEVMLNEVFGPLGDRRYREYIESIRGSGTHLLGLINDVLDMSRLDAGELCLSREELRPGDLIAEAVRAISLQAEAADVSLIEDIEPWLPAIHADRRRIRQVLVNLLTNAVKFTLPEGTVRISAFRHGDNLAIQVADTGIGMAADDIPKALERFSQTDSRQARKSEGAGLGLPLAKQLTELHGGLFEVQSTPGAGTKVTVIFPAGITSPERQAA
jgi:two-component system cell cycle sensor histidine kinase PleC